jgi:hypothetical protein
LNANTGAITGTPSAAGSFSFDITATDSLGCTGSTSYTVNINASCPTITLSPATLPDGTVGTAYSQTVSASGGAAPYTFAVTSGALPAGLSLNGTTGNISGTPSATGTSNFTITATDNNACTGSQAYSITINPSCLFCDDFEDGVLDSNWTYVKPSWTESGGSLNGTPTKRKAIAVARPVFAGCVNCCASASMTTAGGPFNRVWFYNHYVDKSNLIEILMKEENDKWILKQRINKSVVAKAKFLSPILPNQAYDVEVCFNGSQFDVTIDGSPAMTLNPVGAVPNGTIGFAAKNTTGSFGYIQVK